MQCFWSFSLGLVSSLHGQEALSRTARRGAGDESSRAAFLTRTLNRPGVDVGASCSSCQWCAAAAAAGCLKNASPTAVGPAQIIVGSSESPKEERHKLMSS